MLYAITMIVAFTLYCIFALADYLGHNKHPGVKFWKGVFGFVAFVMALIVIF